MKADNQRGFYEEMLKALWGYIGDKLNIPSSNLTKENVREELVKRGVSPADVYKRQVLYHGLTSRISSLRSAFIPLIPSSTDVMGRPKPIR